MIQHLFFFSLADGHRSGHTILFPPSDAISIHYVGNSFRACRNAINEFHQYRVRSHILDEGSY